MEKVAQLQLAQGASILDIGCGDGLFFDRLSTLGEVEGVEPYAALVSPDNPYRSRIHISPFDDAFRPAKKYSLILMLDVLEHLENPLAALRHVSRLLEDNGTFVATVPAFLALWTNHDVLNHHFTRYTKTTFEELVRQTDLRIQEERYLYHWTFPIKLGVRAMERAMGSKPEPPEVRSGWINEMCYHLTRIEQNTLSRLGMPFGSSLFVVAK